MVQIHSEKVLLFGLGNEDFAVSVDQVHSIEKMMPVTEMPNMPEFIKGIVNLRGNILPIVDLRFQLTKANSGENEANIIVVTAAGKQIGLIVDEAKDVIDIPFDAFETINMQQGSKEKSLMVANWNGRLINLLEIETLLEKWIQM